MINAASRLRLVVDNSPGASTDKFSEYARLKQAWDRSRDSRAPDHNLRRAAFQALKAWNPEVAATYGNGSGWGFR